MKNFEKMNFECYKCTIDKVDKRILNKSSNYVAVITDDAFILLEYIDKENINAKIVFWCSIFSIISLKLCREKKIISIDCFNEYEGNQENRPSFSVSLIMEDYIFFRQNLFQKMNAINIKYAKVTENTKIILKLDEISSMSANSIEDQIYHFQEIIEEENNKDICLISTYLLLLEKAVEEFEYIGKQKKKKEFKNLLKKAKEKFAKKFKEEDKKDENNNQIHVNDGKDVNAEVDDSDSDDDDED